MDTSIVCDVLVLVDKIWKKKYLGGHLNRPRPLLTYHSRVGNSCTESDSFTLNKPHDLLFHNDSSSSIWEACVIPSVKNRGIPQMIYKFIYIWHCPSVSQFNNILTWEQTYLHSNQKHRLTVNLINGDDWRTVHFLFLMKEYSQWFFLNPTLKAQSKLKIIKP